MQLYFYPVAQVELMHLGALTVHSHHRGPIVGKYNSSWRRLLKGCSWGDRKNLQKVIWLVLNWQMFLSDKKRELNLPNANKLTACFLLNLTSNHEDCNSNRLSLLPTITKILFDLHIWQSPGGREGERESITRSNFRGLIGLGY